MVRPALTLAACAIALAFLAPSHPATAPGPRAWFVSPKGNDGNAGTESLPLATIQRAADLVNPGDIVTVEDGVYAGAGTATACAAATVRPIVCVTRGGTKAAPVTFLSRHPYGAKLDGRRNASTDGFRVMGGAAFLRIEGFEIFGVGNAAGSSSGVELYNGGTGSVIAGNDIHDVGHLCTDTRNGQVGIFVEQPHVVITRNRIHDIGRFMKGENGCAAGYSGSTDHGVYVNGNRSAAIPGADDTVIDGNVFYNNKRGWSVQLYAGRLERVRIVNNTFAFANPYQDGQIVVGTATVDTVIEHNTFYSPRTAAIYYYEGAQTRLQVRDNTVAGASVMTKVPSGAIVEANRTIPATAVQLP